MHWAKNSCRWFTICRDKRVSKTNKTNEVQGCSTSLAPFFCANQPYCNAALYACKHVLHRCNAVLYACKHVLRLATRFRTCANTFYIVAIRFRTRANTFYIVATTHSGVRIAVTSLQQLIRGSIWPLHRCNN